MGTFTVPETYVFQKKHPAFLGACHVSAEQGQAEYGAVGWFISRIPAISHLSAGITSR